MRILNVNVTLDPITGGGTAERTFQISRSLVKAGAECDLLTLNLGLTSERVKALNEVRVIALPCLVKRFYIPRFSFKQVRGVIENVDVVHLMGHWTFLNALVYFYARRLNKPYVLCPAGALPIYGRSKRLKRLYNRLVGRKIVQNATGHVAITADEALHFRDYGVDPDTVSIIPNGVNRDDYLNSNGSDFRRQYGLGDHPFILFVGRLNTIKGPDLLLRAFCRLKEDLPNHHLVFAGPDEKMLRELEQIVEECGIKERIHFIGHIGGTAKSQAYYACELLAIPSRQEAMSIVALEAGITGTPVLLTDQCGFDEIAEIGGGQVVPASVDGLQVGLIEMLQDPTQLNLRGVNLQEFVKEQFTWTSATKKYLTLYGRLLEKE